MPSKEIMMAIIFLLSGVILVLIKYISDFKMGLSLLSKKYGKLAGGTFEYKRSGSALQELDKINGLIEDTMKNSDEKLREAGDLSAKLRSILKGTSNGIVAIDNEENVLILNTVAKEILGFDKDFEGVTLEKVVKSSGLLAEIREKIYMPKEDSVKISCIDDRYYRIEINRIKISKNEQGEVFSVGKVINISDVTEKHMLEELRAEFVTSVTHELRTPITSIVGFVEAIKENPEMDTQTRNRFLGIIEEESNRLRQMIDDILTLSFVENNEINYEEVEVRQIINKAIQLLDKQAIKKNITILCSIEGNPKISTNEYYLYQILINLLENAIKYSKEGKEVEITCKEEDNRVKIVVRDEGYGIMPQDQNRIFERFYRVDKSRSGKERGTGLGLAIVKHMAMAMDAVVDVKSAVGEGSQFIIELKKQ